MFGMDTYTTMFLCPIPFQWGIMSLILTSMEKVMVV
jgi:hypothetical protein